METEQLPTEQLLGQDRNKHIFYCYDVKIFYFPPDIACAFDIAFKRLSRDSKVQSLIFGPIWVTFYLNGTR